MIKGTVTEKLLQKCLDWLSDFVFSYSDPDPAIQENYDIKRIHTYKVREEIKFLGKELGLKNDALRLAEIIGLFHDLGRFEQYARYKTFKDNLSEDHAALGVKIINDAGLLASFQELPASIIRNAILFHNRLSIPEGEKDPYLFYEKLIRDADKLDIWRVVLKYYYRGNDKINKEIEWTSTQSTAISKKVLEDIHNKRSVLTKHVQNLNDFKLLQMAWVFDLNFEISMEEVKKRKYLEKMRDTLAQSAEIDKVYNILISHSIGD
ncbi:MAG: HD domain-containing protein [Candidatus Neomarinimicrobiota bacterium]